MFFELISIIHILMEYDANIFRDGVRKWLVYFLSCQWQRQKTQIASPASLQTPWFITHSRSYLILQYTNYCANYGLLDSPVSSKLVISSLMICVLQIEQFYQKSLSDFGIMAGQ